MCSSEDAGNVREEKGESITKENYKSCLIRDKNKKNKKATTKTKTKLGRRLKNVSLAGGITVEKCCTE